MPLRVALGMSNSILESLRTAFNGNFKINYYTGTQPASASDAASGTLLVTFSVNNTGAGMSFDAAANGGISKAAAETWSGSVVADGTVGWFRAYIEGQDPAAASATSTRLDGSVATSGAQLNITSTQMQTGALQTITVFDINYPYT